MTYRVTMDETAKSDLREIARAVAEKAGDREPAKKLVHELRARCRELQIFPERGALPRDHLLVSLGYRFLMYKGYPVFYVTDHENKRVFIRSVQHEKMDYTRQTLKLVDYSLNKAHEKISKYSPD